MSRHNGNARDIPVVDPTKNVLDTLNLVSARLDAGRIASDKLNDERIKHVKAEACLRAEHATAMSKAESGRLDAIRQVDQINVTSKAEQTLAAVQALAATNKTEAETLRALVTSTAVTIAAQSESRFNGVDSRIAALEKSSYTAGGRGGGYAAVYGWILGALGAVAILFTIWKAATGH
jgi:hypothetical protein